MNTWNLLGLTAEDYKEDEDCPDSDDWAELLPEDELPDELEDELDELGFSILEL